MYLETELDTYFDFKYLGRCEYGVPGDSLEGVEDCREPAIARIWWVDEQDSLLVCERHFNKVAREENWEISSTKKINWDKNQLELFA